jgi:hypothetical protein
MSRLDKFPPAQWLADVEAALKALFPGAQFSRDLMQQLYPALTAEYRLSARPLQAAKTLCTCDGQRIVAKPQIATPQRLRPPKGARPGDVFGLEDLRESAHLEALKKRVEKLGLEASHAERRANAAGDRAQRARSDSLQKKYRDDQKAYLAQRSRLIDQIIQTNEEIREAREGTASRAKPHARKTRTQSPRAATPVLAPTCPPDLPACSLGLLGGMCGLPATLVLAAAQGAPIPRTARYCLTSVWQITPSHNPLKGFAPNPNYPAGVQERPYDREKPEQLKVMGIAQNLVPELIFNGSPGAIDGLPVVTPTGIVLGGNGRSQGLQLHYAEGGQAARNYLLHQAGQFGFTREQVAQVQDPVVVRVIDTPPPEAPNYQSTLRELVRLLNVPLTQSLDIRSESVAEAHRLNDDAFDALTVGLGEDQTLSEYLSSRQSRPFADALRRSGILTDRNAGRYLTPDGQAFSEDGKTLVERLLTAALVPDAALLDQAGPQLRGTLARGAPWLLSAAASGQPWDLRPAVMAALRDLVALRNQGQPSVDAYLRQTTMYGQPAVNGVPNGEAMLRVLYELGNRPVLFGRFARQYAELSRRHPTAQFSLLPQEQVTPSQAFAQSAAQVMGK